MRNRVVERELLDDLPPESREAACSRKDLVRVNAWMRNGRLAARAIRDVLGPRKRFRMTDIGGGDGRHLARLALILSAHGYSAEATLVDQQAIAGPEVHASLRSLGWTLTVVQAEVFGWTRELEETIDLCVANLFLHHFTDAALRELFATLERKTSAFVAVEPRRNWVALGLTRLLWLIGCNRVTRHDARLSVQAGFTGSELSALWPNSKRWRLREHQGGLSNHLFAAARK